MCPDFLIETYLDHAGEKFSLDFDANSLLYISKAMDLFDLGLEHQQRTAERRQAHEQRLASEPRYRSMAGSADLTLPETPYQEQPSSNADGAEASTTTTSMTDDGPPADLVAGLRPLRDHPTLVLGVASDILFPAWQQREIAETLRQTGNKRVTHVELGEDVSMFGHDTFLLDLEHIGGNIKQFLQ